MISENTEVTVEKKEYSDIRRSSRIRESIDHEDEIQSSAEATAGAKKGEVGRVSGDTVGREKWRKIKNAQSFFGCVKRRLNLQTCNIL